MARYPRYRRTYYKKVYPRKRWCSNIEYGYLDVTVHTTDKVGYQSADLCVNSKEDNVPTPTLIKFGRLKLKGDVRISNQESRFFTSAMLYVVYVPEGVAVDGNIIHRHPEYILGWTSISLDSGNTFSISTALKRNLNTGDKISILCIVDSIIAPSVDITYAFFFNCQYWTTTA